MLKKTIEYTDYNGVKRKEDFWFNLSESEVIEMEVSVTGGLYEMMQQLKVEKDSAKIVETFKKIILKAYGEKSSDGRRFIKIANDGHPLSLDFSQTPAYSDLFMELAFDDKAGAEFINGIMPSSSSEVAVKSES